MNVGDFVKRSNWCTGSNKPVVPDYGVIMELHLRSPIWDHMDDFDGNPLRRVTVLRTDGKIKDWYAIHVEVISEAG